MAIQWTLYGQWYLEALVWWGLAAAAAALIAIPILLRRESCK